MSQALMFSRLSVTEILVAAPTDLDALGNYDMGVAHDLLHRDLAGSRFAGARYHHST